MCNASPECEIATLVTGTFDTVTPTTPLDESLVAMMSAVPGATALTSPDGETVAMVGSVEDHETPSPGSGLPDASLGVAVIAI